MINRFQSHYGCVIVQVGIEEARKLTKTVTASVRKSIFKTVTIMGKPRATVAFETISSIEGLLETSCKPSRISASLKEYTISDELPKWKEQPYSKVKVYRNMQVKNLADLQALCTLGQFRSGAPTPSCIIASLPAPPPQEPVRDKRTAPTATVPRAPRGHPSSKAGARSTTSASAPSKGVLVYPRRKLLSAYTGSGGSTVHRSEIPLRLASTGAPLYIKLETIKPFMHLPQKLAAAHLDISLSSLKYVCRRLGIAKWTRPACVPVATTHHVTDHVTSGPRLHAASKFLPDNGEI